MWLRLGPWTAKCPTYLLVGCRVATDECHHTADVRRLVSLQTSIINRPVVSGVTPGCPSQHLRRCRSPSLAPTTSCHAAVRRFLTRRRRAVAFEPSRAGVRSRHRRRHHLHCPEPVQRPIAARSSVRVRACVRASAKLITINAQSRTNCSRNGCGVNEKLGKY